MITIDWQIELKHPSMPKASILEPWVMQTIQQHQDDAELTIRIVDIEEISLLNQQYRGKSGATNVLSFPADLPEHIDIPLLGDIVICAPVVAEEATIQNKTPAAHWAHIITHGVLHLLGYDHIDEHDAAKMEALETQLITSWGFAEPYRLIE